MIFETAPGVEEPVGLPPAPPQQDVAMAPYRRELSASVREAVQSGSIDQVEAAIVRETIGYLTEPYFDSGLLSGTMDISGRPEQGWSLGASDLDPVARMREVSVARRLSIYSPPAKQAVRLHRVYVIGAGIPKPVALDDDVQEVIDDFWTDPDNFETCTHIGQAETDQRQLVDGELFVAMYVSREDGHVKVRTVDPLDVEDIITHPEDRKRPLYYRVRLHHEDYDFQGGRGMPDVRANQYCYYPDWRNTDPSRDPYRGKAKPRAPDHASMGHWPLNRMGLRGIPDFAAGSVWITQQKKFMENRAILQEALSKIALVKTVKGGAPQVGGLAQAEQSSFASSLQTWEHNPATSAGSTYVKNQGIELEQLRVDTGAGNAVRDGEMLAQMIGTAFGLPTHYILMSTEAQRLATAVAMELPVLKMYEDAQRRWLDMLRSVIDFVLLQAAKYGRLNVPVITKHGREIIDWQNAPPPPDEAEEQQTDEMGLPVGDQDTAPPAPNGAQPPPGAAPAAPPPYGAVQQGMVREQGAPQIDPLLVTSQVEHMRQREATSKQENKERGNYTINMPPILAREVATEVGTIVQAVQASLLTPEQGAYLVMTTLSFDDVSDRMTEWREWVETHARHINDASEAQQQQMQQQMQMQQQAAGAGAGAPPGMAPGMGAPEAGGAPGVPTQPPGGGGDQTATTAGASVPSGGMSGAPSAGPNG